MAIWLQTGNSKILVELKFGGEEEPSRQKLPGTNYWWNLFGNSSLSCQTAKFNFPPIFPVIQYFMFNVHLHVTIGLIHMYSTCRSYPNFTNVLELNQEESLVLQTMLCVTLIHAVLLV